jgi:hypothetical protein
LNALDVENENKMIKYKNINIFHPFEGEDKNNMPEENAGWEKWEEFAMSFNGYYYAKKLSFKELTGIEREAYGLEKLDALLYRTLNKIEKKEKIMIEDCRACLFFLQWSGRFEEETSVYDTDEGKKIINAIKNYPLVLGIIR